MRFHPKSRASTDQRPGPSIASAAAMVAANRAANGSAAVRVCEISITATTAPATGVHSPVTRRNPDIASDAEVTVICNDGSLHSGGPYPKQDRADDQAHNQQAEAGPTAGERGVEASQHVLLTIRFVVATRRVSPHWAPGVTLSGGGDGTRGTRAIYSSMIPLLRPMIAACVRSLASSFARMLLTRPLTVSSVMAS